MLSLYCINYDAITDEGISATNTKHRKGFKRMIDDAMTAHVSIVFARYTMLSLEQRRNADKRSIGDLFFGECKIVCVKRNCTNLLYAPYWGNQS